MQYYIQRYGRVEGPLSVGEINSKMASGLVDLHWLATSDLGEPLENILKAPERDWFPITEIPGVRGLPHPRETPKHARSNACSVAVAVLVILIFFALLFALLRFQSMFQW